MEASTIGFTLFLESANLSVL